MHVSINETLRALEPLVHLILSWTNTSLVQKNVGSVRRR
jgi:hypothetical protein